jgi:NADP-dependent 3-hydroxy acid dehydrogenase YdfG
MLTVLQAALSHLAEQASITLVGAISAHAAMPGTAGIGAVNAAVESVRHVSSADEIGEAVALLATNTSMTGTILEIDGGARLVQL